MCIWENLDKGCEYRPNALRFVHMAEVEHARHRGVRMQFLSGAYSVLISVKF